MSDTLTLLRLLCVSPSRRDAFDIAKAAHKVGEARGLKVGEARGYERCRQELAALVPAARQPASPSCEAART